MKKKIYLVCFYSGMRFCEVTKEMSSLYFGLAVFCLFDDRVPDLTHSPPPVQCALYTEHCVKFWDISFKLSEYI